MKKDIKKGYFRYPAIHKNKIVFTAEGDLWTCGIKGGTAQRITSHHSSETNAKISPDGNFIAFTGRYEGTPEVYIIPMVGGLPKRLTFNIDAARVVNWTADGKIIYCSNKSTGLPNSRLFIIDPETLKETPVKLNQASDGIYDGSQKNLYFTRLPFQGSHTKRYKGGFIEQLWKFDGKKKAIPLTASFSGTSKAPMLFKERIYFASDRDGTMNVWSMNTTGKNLKQHTFHKDFDIRYPDHHNGKIIYQIAGEIHIYEIENNKSVKIGITLISDFDQTREKWISKPLDYLTDYDIPSDGSSLLLTSRGRVFSMPAKKGRLIHAAGKEGVRYKHAVYMPDYKSFLS
ncbi:MAG: PD40 domain-containing protein, partial [Candidatus Delongbacteria bacterium]|nr:PD40 domain-containing protein [Candidatus Delongbacteria bacterium]